MRTEDTDVTKNQSASRPGRSGASNAHETWTLGTLVQNDGSVAILAGDERVARVDVGNTPTGSARAHLIAAAPELLDALRELVARCDGEEGVRADGSNIQTMRAHAVLATIDGDGAAR